MKTETLTIDLPDDLPAAVVKEVDTAYLKEAIAAFLYHAGKISEKQACDIVGKTRREFEDLLPKFGFSLMPDTDEDIQLELNA